MKHNEIKKIVGIMQEINKHYGLSDEQFVESVIDVVKKCGIAVGTSEHELRLAVADICRPHRYWWVDPDWRVESCGWCSESPYLVISR